MRKVAEIASGWVDANQMSLKLDFGKAGKPRRCDPDAQRQSQIRVSYDQPGYWSVVGQVSVVYLTQQEASLNLEGFGDADLAAFDNPDIKGIILHEFGHALGLLHEHQSPSSACAQEFDWNHIVSYLSGPPNNWDEDTIKTNMATGSGRRPDDDGLRPEVRHALFLPGRILHERQQLLLLHQSRE